MTTRDLGENLLQAAHDLGLQREATRRAVIQALYATTGDRRCKISLGEICCITGWSGSSLDRHLRRKKDGGRRSLYGKAEKPPLGGRPYQRYKLDEVDKWLREEHKGTWDEIQRILKANPPKATTLAQVKTVEQAVTVPLPVLLDIQNKIEQIISLREPLATLIRAAQAGKTLGFATLADAMTQYTWSSNKHREKARKVWLRVLDSKQKQIVRYRELDQEQAAATVRLVFERALPKGRPRHRGRKRLGD